MAEFPNLLRRSDFSYVQWIKSCSGRFARMDRASFPYDTNINATQINDRKGDPTVDSSCPPRFRCAAHVPAPAAPAICCALLSGEEEDAASSRCCLLTSRDTGRWVIPKGWPMNRQDAAYEVAAREAFEEAGVRGTVENRDARRLLPIRRF